MQHPLSNPESRSPEILRRARSILAVTAADYGLGPAATAPATATEPSRTAQQAPGMTPRCAGEPHTRKRSRPLALAD